jgi:hypothetical protein
MSKFPKVLVASPTARAKAYCFESWVKNAMGFTYPNYNIMLFDNTAGGPSFTYEMNERFANMYGENNDKFLAAYDSEANKEKSIFAKMAVSHSAAARWALRNGYEYLLHLESDVFPEPNIIEELLFCGKPICGGLYHRDEGVKRRLTVQMPIMEAPDRIRGENFEAGEDLFFVDGSVKPVSHIGLGCVLIHRSVLEKVKFRWDPKRDVHPDTIWAEDVKKAGYTVYANTKVICRHENKAWGQYGWNYK